MCSGFFKIRRMGNWFFRDSSGTWAGIIKVKNIWGQLTGSLQQILLEAGLSRACLLFLVPISLDYFAAAAAAAPRLSNPAEIRLAHPQIYPTKIAARFIFLCIVRTRSFFIKKNGIFSFFLSFIIFKKIFFLNKYISIVFELSSRAGFHCAARPSDICNYNREIASWHGVISLQQHPI